MSRNSAKERKRIGKINVEMLQARRLVQLTHECE